ncbi:MAG TPA: hypothetical protein PL093_01235 [Candidatus Pacearchaeota archaeon]|nr:hypothetical protein [Candidatus Pacearchaeota archaeon]HRU20880.1 hypothetical protein [Candidatus Paceibacterota bacterium]HPC30698.1 hypothetical protein [Candidatus Pacearchaeota archaeon]HQG09415.1 hypothetical protein [Candidatus Pacearchaeota archaeon]HQH20184.1 hypothetical protein [Candidatus Pacearchaeota archaeon]
MKEKNISIPVVLKMLGIEFSELKELIRRGKLEVRYVPISHFTTEPMITEQSFLRYEHQMRQNSKKTENIASVASVDTKERQTISRLPMYNRPFDEKNIVPLQYFYCINNGKIEKF